jgi:hypothetical protein
MILIAHLLLGAAIGQKISNPFLAVILAIMSHYFLDIFPHTEYPIENIRNNQWRKALPDILSVILDFFLGVVLIFLFSKNNPIIYICGFFAIMPDGLTVLNSFFQNKILQAHNKFHEKIHFLKHKKISNFWRIACQLIAVLISVILLRY